MPNYPLFPNCSIVLLAGGRGQRMDGQDKGWVMWQGQALIEHMQRVVRPLTDDLIISCNRNHARYQMLADQLVSDPDQDFSGPLVGIISALQVARHPYLIVLPCDAPRIDQALLLQLYQQAGKRLYCLNIKVTGNHCLVLFHAPNSALYMHYGKLANAAPNTLFFTAKPCRNSLH